MNSWNIHQRNQSLEKFSICFNKLFGINYNSPTVKGTKTGLKYAHQWLNYEVLCVDKTVWRELYYALFPWNKPIIKSIIMSVCLFYSYLWFHRKSVTVLSEKNRYEKPM